jgi:hypothetical protein
MHGLLAGLERGEEVGKGQQPGTLSASGGLEAAAWPDKQLLVWAVLLVFEESSLAPATLRSA